LVICDSGRAVNSPPGSHVVFKRSIVLAVMLAGSVGVAAQPQRAADPRQDNVKARYNIFTMEAVLERAVEHGADQLRRQVRRVMPDMLLLSGAAEARGFRLEGYGVFFDVEVPALRESVAWQLRTMIDENGTALTTALQQLKAFVQAQSIQDARAKQSLEQALKRIELVVGPVQPSPPPPAPSSPPGPTTPGAVTALTVDPPSARPQSAPAPPPVDTTLLEDPNQSYEREVKDALIDAMLDYSGPLGIGPEEWLTIAARDNEHRDRFSPGDPFDTITIVLRIKGSDLAAFRADRITKDEARKRVEVREF
jgi:hypothetical protein